MTKTKAKASGRPRPGASRGKTLAKPKTADPLDLRLATAQRGVLAAAVVLAGVAVWRPALEPFMLPKLTAILLGVVAVLVLAGIRAVRQGQISLPSGTPVILALALAAALTLATLTADHQAQSLVGRHGRYSGLLSYLAYLAVFLITLRLYALREARGLIRALAVAGGIVATYGLLQVAGLDPYQWVFRSEGLSLNFSTMGNTNFAAGYVAMIAPVLAAVVVLPGWSRIWRLVGAGLLAVTLVYAVATQSIQGPLAAAAGLVVVGAAWLLARRREGSPLVPGGVSLRRALPIVAVLGIGALALLAVRVLPEIQASLGERRYFWRAAFGILADRPLLGAGFDSFRDYFTPYRAPEHAVAIGFDAADSPHSLPLGMLSSGGLPLGLTYLAFVGYTGWTLVRGMLSAPADRLPTLAAFGGMWAAYQAQSLVSVDIPALSLLHFLSAGMIFAVVCPSTSWALRLPVRPAARGAVLPSRPGSARVLAAAGLVLVLVLGLAAGWWSTRPLRADLAAAAARQAVDAAGKVEKLDRAVRLAPWEAEYRLLQGRALIEAGDTTRAYESALAAAELRPGSSKLALGVADFAQKRGDPETAAVWIDEALRRDPVNPFLLEDVAALVLAKGETERADELTQRAASLRADHADF